MKVVCLQMDMQLGCTDENFAHAQQLIQDAMAEKPDVLVLPETWNTGFFPKENLSGLCDCDGERVKEEIGTLAAKYRVNIVAGSSGNEVTAAMVGMTKVAALAYLMFNLFTPPCFAAIGAMNAEIKDKKWLFGGIALQLATGFTVAFWVYQIGTWITTGTLGAGFIPGLIAFGFMAAVVVYLCVRSDAKRKAECTLSGRK